MAKKCEAEEQLETVVKELMPSTAPMMQQLKLLSDVRVMIAAIRADERAKVSKGRPVGWAK